MKEKEEQSKRQTEPVYSKTYTVEPAEGNGQQELPLTNTRSGYVTCRIVGRGIQYAHQKPASMGTLPAHRRNVPLSAHQRALYFTNMDRRV